MNKAYIYSVPFNFLREIDRITTVIVFEVNSPRMGNKNEKMVERIPNFKA